MAMDTILKPCCGNSLSQTKGCHCFSCILTEAQFVLETWHRCTLLWIIIYRWHPCLRQCVFCCYKTQAQETGNQKWQLYQPSCARCAKAPGPGHLTPCYLNIMNVQKPVGWTEQTDTQHLSGPVPGTHTHSCLSLSFFISLKKKKKREFFKTLIGWLSDVPQSIFPFI